MGNEQTKAADTRRKETGRRGEDATADYLVRQGYQILDRNWHCRGGELDIVATRGGIIAFVEVKTRTPSAMVTPFQAVNYRKQQRVITAATAYLVCHQCDLQPRFDVAAVIVTGEHLAVEYLPAAYDAQNRY